MIEVPGLIAFSIAALGTAKFRICSAVSDAARRRSFPYPRLLKPGLQRVWKAPRMNKRSHTRSRLSSAPIGTSGPSTAITEKVVAAGMWRLRRSQSEYVRADPNSPLLLQAMPVVGLAFEKPTSIPRRAISFKSTKDYASHVSCVLKGLPMPPTAMHSVRPGSTSIWAYAHLRRRGKGHHAGWR
jgi:hypothetical protein